MNPLVVLNPNAGGGKTGRAADRLLAAIRDRIGEVDLATTERRGHATELAEQGARRGVETVLAVGGDGTIHEVVQGLMRARGSGTATPRLGIIGRGTGGDLRKTLGIEHRLDAYLDAIAAGRTRAIDVGRFTFVDNDGRPAEAFFVNILSMGLGGLVDRNVAELGRSFSGPVAYFLATWRALRSSAVGELRCRLRDGREERTVTLATRNLAICNGRFFGSGMHVAPMAAPDDGRFHVVALGAGSRLGFSLSSLSIYSGKHIERRDVQVFDCEAIDVELVNDEVRDRFLLDVDGEPLGRLPVGVELEPRAVDVFVPS